MAFLIPRHIKQQYKYRYVKANPECHKKKECIGCGCKMPEVLLADKPCRMGCYGPMLNKKQWKTFKKINNINTELL